VMTSGCIFSGKSESSVKYMIVALSELGLKSSRPGR
jgi:hypothetical protein